MSMWCMYLPWQAKASANSLTRYGTLHLSLRPCPMGHSYAWLLPLYRQPGVPPLSSKHTMYRLLDLVRDARTHKAGLLGKKIVE